MAVNETAKVLDRHPSHWSSSPPTIHRRLSQEMNTSSKISTSGAKCTRPSFNDRPLLAPVEILHGGSVTPESRMPAFSTAASVPWSEYDFYGTMLAAGGLIPLITNRPRLPPMVSEVCSLERHGLITPPCLEVLFPSMIEATTSKTVGLIQVRQGWGRWPEELRR
jgi:hypothetical protein